jgi:hypothetical protein
MVQAASRPIELNRQGNACRNSGDQAEKRTQAQAVTDTEDQRISYRAGKQPQGTVLSAQQIVGEIETTEHVETGAGNTDRREDMVVHSGIVEGQACQPEPVTA